MHGVSATEAVKGSMQSDVCGGELSLLALACSRWLHCGSCGRKPQTTRPQQVQLGHIRWGVSLVLRQQSA